MGSIESRHTYPLLHVHSSLFLSGAFLADVKDVSRLEGQEGGLFMGGDSRRFARVFPGHEEGKR